jgi:hypothetical protein
MKKLVLATAVLAAAVFVAVPMARADWVGAGAGTGLLVAGPIGAVAGGVIGGVFGKPFWGPSVGRHSFDAAIGSRFRRGFHRRAMGLQNDFDRK